MAKWVNEIMNAEVFTVRPTDRTEDVLGYILSLGITGAPVVDKSGAPAGFFSLRDGLRAEKGASVREHMTKPAYTLYESATAEDAASVLANKNLHHAVVVSDQGQVVGVVSALDLLKALTGIPVTHPAAFPHYDHATGLTWTDDATLDLENADVAPDGPGLLALVAGGAGRPERLVWGEACSNVRSRVYDLLSAPQTDNARLAKILDTGNLRFRTALVPEHARRREALGVLIEQTRSWMVPRGVET